MANSDQKWPGSKVLEGGECDGFMRRSAWKPPQRPRITLVVRTKSSKQSRGSTFDVHELRSKIDVVKVHYASRVGAIYLRPALLAYVTRPQFTIRPYRLRTDTAYSSRKPFRRSRLPTTQPALQHLLSQPPLNTRSCAGRGHNVGARSVATA
jgi:hypothetical protein